MSQQVLDPQSLTPQSKVAGAVLGAVAVGLLVAFWSVCSDQVQTARTRDAQLHLQQTALVDCLQRGTGSTISSCSLEYADGSQPLRAHSAMLMMPGQPSSHVNLDPGQRANRSAAKVSFYR